MAEESAGKKNTGHLAGAGHERARQRRLRNTNQGNRSVFRRGRGPADLGGRERSGGEGVGAGAEGREAREDPARPKTFSATDEADGKDRTRDAAVFVFAAADDREAQLRRSDVPAIQCAGRGGSGRTGGWAAKAGTNATCANRRKGTGHSIPAN